MELVESNTAAIGTTSINEGGGEDDGVLLPGFRFHPTDQELVGFYLRRKVEKKPISLQLIKHADIYKYDPWDLPKSNTDGDNEWYFFCKRGRKYRNSVRPNRVTGSGFWKATGIDRPVYSTGSGGGFIGLKKSLVFYRGSAGKGTKTDWMMHEFRLPPSSQEAEVWTLCRILKRKVSIKKWCTKEHGKEIMESNSKTYSHMESLNQNMNNYISFSAPNLSQNHDDMIMNKPYFSHMENPTTKQFPGSFFFSPSPPPISQPPSTATSSCSTSCADHVDIDGLLGYGDWEDLQSMVDTSFAANPFSL